MKNRRLGSVVSSAFAAAGLLAATALGLACAANPETTATAQKTFPSPDAAAAAMVDAAERFDVEELKALLGPDDADLVVTGDAVQDKKNATGFAAEARSGMRVVRDPKNSESATIVVGNEDWPMPIPIVMDKSGWRFDSKTGRQEVLLRRVGRNELDAIDVCRGYVEAQHDYAMTKHDGSPVNQYAQRVISTPGKQDGLAWKDANGVWQGPVAEGIARVIAEGYTDRFQPYHGYYFKILKGQGPAAPLGEMDFVVRGVMIGGFAMVAAPSDYGVTGVKTFLVSHDGVVYEKDLGEDTGKLFREMTRFNPDKTWSAVAE